MKTFHQLRLRFTGIATLALLSTFAFSDQEELNPNTPQSAVNLPPGAPPLPPDTDIGTSDQAGQETSIDEEGNSTGNDGDSYPPSELREQGYDNSDSDPNHDTSGDGDCESPRPRPQPPYNDPYPPDVPDPESPPYDDPGECFHHVFRLHGPGNLSSGFVRFFTYDFENPGMDGLTYNLPANFEIITKPIPRPNEPTIFFPGIEAVDTGAGTISFGPAPQNMLAIDPNAFVAKEKTAGGYEFRTTMIYFINEGGIDRLRMDVTEHGKLLRYEQTNPEPNKLVTSIGPVENDNFTPLRRSTLTKNHDNPDRRIERKIFEEWSVEASGFVVVSDHEIWREAYMTPKAAARLNLSSVRPSPPDRGGEGSERAHVSGPGLRVPVGQDSNGRSFNVVTPGHRWRVIRQIINPDGPKPLTNDWTYYDAKDVTASGASRQSIGRVKSYRMYDGRQATYTYGLNTYTVKTPYADDPEGLVTTSTWNPGTRTRTLTRSVNGQEISRVVLTYTNTRLTHTRYTSATETLTTIIDYKPDGQLFGGFPTRVVHSDGTLTTYDYEREDTGGITTTTENGSTDNNATNVIEGLRTIVTTNSRGHTIYRETQAIGFDDADGKIYERMAVTEIDARGRPEVTLWHPATLTYVGEVAIASDEKWRTSTVQFCCGPYSVTDRNGITTTYAYDGLKRRIKSNRLGVTTETHYLGLTTETHRYPETVSGNLSPELNGTGSTLVGRSSRNLTGTTMTTDSPDLTALDNEGNGIPGAYVTSSSITTTYAPAAGLSRRTVTLVPGGHQQVTDYYLDGRTHKTTGALAPDMEYEYSVNSIGETTSQSFLNTENLKLETSLTQTDRAGRTLQTAKGTIVTAYTYFDSSADRGSRGQLARVTDADGVTTRYAYNPRGERTTTANKLNNVLNEITYGTDRVTSSETFPALRGTSPVWRSISKVWKDGDANATGGTVVSITDQTPDGLQSWSWTLGTGPAFTDPGAIFATSLTTLGKDNTTGLGNGNWSITQTNPDDTFTVTTYVSGRMDITRIFEAGANPEQDAPLTFMAARDATNAPLSGYDDLNRPTHQRDSRTGVTTTEYLSATADVVKSVTTPGNRTTSFKYDIRGRRTHVDAPNTVDADNNVLENITITSYDPDGTVTQVSGGQTYPVSYTYDHANRMKTMTTTGAAGNTITAWNYFPATGLLQSKRYASNLQGSSGSGPDYTYTDAGRLLTRKWARSLDAQPAVRVQATYGYTFGLLTSVTYNDGTPNVAYNYDAFPSNNAHIPGDLETVTSNGVTWTYTYDPDNFRLLSETHPVGGEAVERILSRQYDSLGRSGGFTLGTTVDPDLDHTVAYGFDTAGRPDEVSSLGKTFTYGFVDQGPHLIATITGPADMLVTNQWMADRDALHWKKNEVASDPVSQFTYGVNEIGQRANVVTTGSAFGNTNRGWQWGYDALGQATKAVHAANSALDRAYVFDTIGNRTSATDGSGGGATTTYTPNALNQYSAINPGTSVNPVHDLDGNLRDDAGINALTYGLKYEWDAENRITAVRKADDTLLVTYTYDPFGRRIRKTTTTSAYQGSSDIAYLYEGWNVVAEYEITSGPSIDLEKTYIWGLDLSGTLQGAGGVGGLLAMSLITNNSITNNYFPTYDGNGNISEYIKDDGTAAAHFEYDPFGRLVHSTGTPSLFTYRFSTKPQDFETGLYYYGYRWYDPYTGRWPSIDPIGERGGINLYGFVGNDGVNYIDVLGLHGIFDYELSWQSDLEAARRDRINRQNETHNRFECCNQEIRDNGRKLLMRRFDIALLEQIADGVEQGERRPEEGGNPLWSCENLNSGLLSALTTDKMPEYYGFLPDSLRKEKIKTFMATQGIPMCWTCRLERRIRITKEKKYFIKRVRRDHWVVICSGRNSKGDQVEEAEFDLWFEGAIPGQDPDEGFRKRYPIASKFRYENVPHVGCSGIYNR